MKKVFFTIALIMGAIQFSNAQISYGIKAGLNFASPSDAIVIEDNGNTKSSIDANTSWHAGGWFRVKIPIVGLYVRPEVIYTSISSTLPIANLDSPTIKLNRLDIPVLVGLKIFGIGNVFAGPVFEYVLKSDIDIDEINSIKSDDFFVGTQFGVGFEFWKLGLDIRYETAFSSNNSTFEIPGGAFYELDNAPDQFIVGLSYKF